MISPIRLSKLIVPGFVSLFFFQQTFAQTSAPVIESPKILALSANAAALGRYGDIPVSQYTGVPSISIPVHTLTYADLAVDISLSYHGGGVRVEDEAAWTGLNWSLNAGGVITRSIRDADDFHEFTNSFTGFKQAEAPGFFKGAPIPSYAANSAHIQGEYTWVNGWDNIPSTFYNYLRSMQSHDIDGQPDILNFNFCGHSGKFIIDKKRSEDESYHIVLYSQEDLDIELVNDDITGQQGFKITDDKGIVYWFQQLEVARSRSSQEKTGKLLYGRESIPDSELPNVNRSIVLEWALNSHFANRISSWYLTKIVNAAGTAQIDFTYETLPVYMRSLPSRVQNNSSYDNHVGDPRYSANYSITATETKNVYLKQISCKGTTITFNTTDRLDMMKTGDVSARKLQSVDFAYQGITKKIVAFDYGYFDSGSGSPDYISKRLKLRRVEFRDPANNTGPKYDFQYYETDHLVLPNKDSYAQDLFGFYNGKRDNDSKANFLDLLPDEIMTQLFPGAVNNTSNRAVDAHYVTAGLLRRVYYPTGGSTAFAYESNDYSNREALNYSVGNYYLIGGNGGEMLMTPPSDVVNDITFTQGAGCRVKEVINYASGNTVASRKAYTYRYSLGSSESSGKLMFGMKLLRFDQYNKTYLWSSQSMYAIPSSAAGAPLGYSKVQEIQYDSENQYNGYTEYTFENEVESNSGLFVLEINPEYCNMGGNSSANAFQYTTDQSAPYIKQCAGWQNPTVHFARRDIFSPSIPNVVHASNGNMKDYAVYSRTSGLLYRKTDHYEEFNEEKIKCIVSQSFTGDPGDATINGIIFNETSVFKALTSSTVVENGITRVTNYSFDPSYRHYKTQSVSSVNSRNEEQVTGFSYFTDYDVTNATGPRSLGVRYLKDKHIYSPIEITRSKGSGENKVIMGGSCFEYSDTNGKLQAVYSAEIRKPIPYDQFAESSIDASGIFATDDRYSLKKRIGSFNSLGQPKEITAEGAYTNAFVWDETTSELLAEASNTLNNNIAYTSFETAEEGNWNYTGVPLADATAPVGKKIYSLSGGFDVTKSGLDPLKTYKVTYWSQNGQKTVNGTTVTPGKVANGWQYFEHKVVNPSGGTITVAGTGGLDELRLFPESSVMKSYVHEELVGTTDIVDANNVAAYYKYDDFNRLAAISDENKDILKLYKYNYEQSTLYGIYFNAYKTGIFTRNNCPTDFEGSTVYYGVPYATYTSPVSQQDANQLAENDINANGQAYANFRGVCRTTVVSPPEYVDYLEVNYSNFTSVRFTATYTNTATGAVYNFTLNPNSHPDIPLMTIPSGVYDITIVSSESGGSYDMSVHTYYTYGAPSLSATGINLHCNCGHIEIAEH